MFVVLGLQLVVTNALTYLWGGGYLARERQRYVTALEAITQATADDPRETVWLGIGELGVFNFDLAYHASKSPGYYQGRPPSYYSIETRLAEIHGDVEVLWKQIEATREVDIVLLREPPPPLDRRNPDDNWQKVIEGTREISSRVRRSANFERMETPDSWEVEIYRDVSGKASPGSPSTGVR